MSASAPSAVARPSKTAAVWVRPLVTDGGQAAAQMPVCVETRVWPLGVRNCAVHTSYLLIPTQGMRINGKDCANKDLDLVHCAALKHLGISTKPDDMVMVNA